MIFLGTGAADFSPLLKTEYRDRLGDDVRRSSSVLLCGRYLIDCGPHTLDSMRILGLDASKVTDIFITHFHSDHYDPESVQKLADIRGGQIRIWFREGARAVFPEGVQRVGMKMNNSYNYGELTVTGLAANHSAYPQHFLFCIGGRKFFYGCDGAWLLTDTFNRLKNEHIDVFVLDCTVGDYAGDYRMAEHNSVPMVRLMLPSLKTAGIVGEGSLVYVSHIAHTLHTSHAALVCMLAPDGIGVACDGLVIKL